MFTLSNGSFGVGVERGGLLPVQQGYVEIQPESTFGVYLHNQTTSVCSAAISINGDLQGVWILKPFQSATILNPDPAYGEGLFKAVAKASQDWVDGGMDEVAKSDRGTISVKFTPGVNPKPTYTNPPSIGAPRGEDDYESYGVGSRGVTRGGSKGGFTLGASKGISSSTHEQAGVVLEGNSVQQFNTAEFVPSGIQSSTIELSLVLKKQSNVRPTGARSINRPPAL